jgi:hypothetical protein
MMQCSVQTSDRLVRQVGQNIGDLDGCETVDLDDTQASALTAALAEPNDGIFLAPDGHVTVVEPSRS